jgi:hypothetical protein
MGTVEMKYTYTFWCGIFGGTAVWKVGGSRREEWFKMNKIEAECEGRLD